MALFFRSAFVAVLLVLSTACAGTRLTSAWKDPETTTLHFDKVLVAVMTPDQSLRREAEDQLVLMIGPDRATASYTLFPGDKAPDKDAALAKIAEAGYEGVVILREVGSDFEVTYVPGTVTYTPVYVSYGPYWTSGWAQTYTPGYLTTEVTMKIETRVYDVRRDKLVWASQSETTNPSSLRPVVDGVARSVGREMRRQHLIP